MSIGLATLHHRSRDHPSSFDNGQQADGYPEKRRTFKNALAGLSGNWFVLPMNSGILGILMHQLPWQFNGLGIISSLMFVWTLVQFIMLGIAFLYHWIRYRKVAKRITLTDMDEMCFLGAAPIAFFTIISLIALNITSTYWGGRSWSFVAYAFWYIDVAWMLATCFGVSITLFRKELSDLSSISFVLCIPVVGLATAAVTGGLIANYSHDLYAGPSVPLIIISFMLVGMSIWLAMIIYTIFFLSMVSYGWPKEPRRPLMVMLVGPAGQAAAALLLLGTASAKHFGVYNTGTFITASSASSLQSSCVFVALLLLGFDVFFIIVSIWGVVEGAWTTKTATYSMVWWATIFPLGTTTTAFIVLSESLGSETFKGLAAAFLIILTVDYLVNLTFTTYHLLKGDMHLGKDPVEFEER